MYGVARVILVWPCTRMCVRVRARHVNAISSSTIYTFVHARARARPEFSSTVFVIPVIRFNFGEECSLFSLITVYSTTVMTVRLYVHKITLLFLSDSRRVYEDCYDHFKNDPLDNSNSTCDYHSPFLHRYNM